jgi:hypothetical protein
LPIKFQCGSRSDTEFYAVFFCRKTVVAKWNSTEKLYVRSVDFRNDLKVWVMLSSVSEWKWSILKILSIVKQCRLLKFIVAVFIIKAKQESLRTWNNAINRPTVFF